MFPATSTFCKKVSLNTSILLFLHLTQCQKDFNTRYRPASPAHVSMKCQAQPVG